MALPEIVIQTGVQRAWQFLQDNSHLVGVMLSTLRVERQQYYRDWIRNNTPAIVFQNPIGTPMLPVIAIQLLGESEKQAYLDDQGLTVRYSPEALKYPPPQPEDFRRDGYYGIDYNLTYADELDLQSRYLMVAGDRSKSESQHHAVPTANAGIQRAGGDEQYERIGEPARLFDSVRAHISTLAVLHQVQMGIEINAESAEQCFVLYRLLQPILERFSTWFHSNGIQNATFTGSELSNNEALQPSTGGVGAFRRMITMSFDFESRNHTLDSVLAGWMLEVCMLTKKSDGTTDEITIATVEKGTSQE